MSRDALESLVSSRLGMFDISTVLAGFAFHDEQTLRVFLGGALGVGIRLLIEVHCGAAVCVPEQFLDDFHLLPFRG